jgi:hypothetical protein
MWIDCLYNICLKQFSFYEELSEILLKMYVGLHANYPLFLSDLIKKIIQCVPLATEPCISL